MNLEKTSHWITIVGNAGLLIGVVLVIFQINQNSDLVREQLEQSRWSDELSMYRTLMGENPAAAVSRAIESPSALSLEDSIVLDSYLIYWGHAENRKILTYRRGMTIIPPPTYTPDDPRIGLATNVLGNAYFKARFEETGLGPLLTPKLRPLINSLTGNESWDEYQRVIARIKEP